MVEVLIKKGKANVLLPVTKKSWFGSSKKGLPLGWLWLKGTLDLSYDGVIL